MSYAASAAARPSPTPLMNLTGVSGARVTRWIVHHEFAGAMLFYSAGKGRKQKAEGRSVSGVERQKAEMSRFQFLLSWKGRKQKAEVSRFPTSAFCLLPSAF